MTSGPYSPNRTSRSKHALIGHRRRSDLIVSKGGPPPGSDVRGRPLPRYLGTTGLPITFFFFIFNKSLLQSNCARAPLSARDDVGRPNSADGASPPEHERISREPGTMAAGQRKKSAANPDHPGRVICSVMSSDGCGADVWRLTAAARTCEFGRDMTLSPVSSRR